MSTCKSCGTTDNFHRADCKVNSAPQSDLKNSSNSIVERLSELQDLIDSTECKLIVYKAEQEKIMQSIVSLPEPVKTDRGRYKSTYFRELENKYYESDRKTHTGVEDTINGADRRGNEQ